MHVAHRVETLLQHELFVPLKRISRGKDLGHGLDLDDTHSLRFLLVVALLLLRRLLLFLLLLLRLLLLLLLCYPVVVPSPSGPLTSAGSVALLSSSVLAPFVLPAPIPFNQTQKPTNHVRKPPFHAREEERSDKRVRAVSLLVRGLLRSGSGQLWLRSKRTGRCTRRGGT